MRVWRICKAEHTRTAFSGEGALRYSGRWHHAGTPVVYCSESRALAALEQLVHLHRNRLPPRFVSFGVEIPADLPVPGIEPGALPADWRQQPAPPELRDIGTRWAAAQESVLLRVPSAVVPEEHNFLLNPRHPDLGRIEIGDPEPFELDARLVERSAPRRSGPSSEERAATKGPVRRATARRILELRGSGLWEGELGTLRRDEPSS